MTTYQFDAIGTHWQIELSVDLPNATADALLQKIHERIAIFDKHYSRFRADSLVTAMSHHAGAYPMPDDALPLFMLYRDLYERTDGLMTPLIGTLISDAGYDATYTLIQTKDLVSPAAWDDAIKYDHPTLTIKQPVLIDVGAAGKGYLIDIVGGVIEAAGITRYCIDAGGDILYKGIDPIRIGLENPFNTQEVIGVYKLHNGSICGSAGNRRAWGTYNHVFNPKTRESVKDTAAVWVTASTALVADALATALFFVEPAALMGYEFDYLIIRSDGSYEKSAHFSDEVFVLG